MFSQSLPKQIRMTKKKNKKKKPGFPETNNDPFQTDSESKFVKNAVSMLSIIFWGLL